MSTPHISSTTPTPKTGRQQEEGVMTHLAHIFGWSGGDDLFIILTGIKEFIISSV